MLYQYTQKRPLCQTKAVCANTQYVLGNAESPMRAPFVDVACFRSHSWEARHSLGRCGEGFEVTFFPPWSVTSRDSHGCHDNQLSGGLTNNSSNILNDNRAATQHCLDLGYSCYLATRLAALFFWRLLTEKPAALQVCIQHFKAAEFAGGETQSRELSQHIEEKSESRWKGGKSVGEVEASCV